MYLEFLGLPGVIQTLRDLFPIKVLLHESVPRTSVLSRVEKQDKMIFHFCKSKVEFTVIKETRRRGEEKRKKYVYWSLVKG